MAETIAYALTTYAGVSATAATVWSYVIVIAATVAYGSYQQRKAEKRARDAANASAKDREIMIRSAVAPRRYVYGRDRISGPIVYMQSTGDKSQFLHMVIALADHECDAIEDIYFNEIKLPALDGDGFVTEGEFMTPVTTEAEQHSGVVSGGSITLPSNAAAILQVYVKTEVESGFRDDVVTGWSHTTETDTITGLADGVTVYVNYTVSQPGIPRVRVKKHLGESGQVADADLVTESGGLWTADHVGNGVTYLYVRLEYDQDIFGSIGIPNISAVVRGKKVLDPRTSTTAWSNNAALCAADWIKSSVGLRAVSGEVPDSELVTAANICDEDIDLILDGSVTQKRYTIDSSWTTEQSPRDVLNDMALCMAGRAVWTQGRWLLRAGAHRTPLVTITADMLAGPVTVVPKASRSDLYNAVRATHRDDSRDYEQVQAPLVTNSGYEADDGGVRIVRPIDIPTLADTYRAQRLAKIELERARQAVTVRLSTNLSAYDLAPSDTCMLTLPLYGWSAKVFEVLERTLTREGVLQYTLRETAAGVWDWNYGEATVGDLAPDTDLPSPFATPTALTGLTVTQDAEVLSDGTVITRAKLTWDASNNAFVIDGGSISVQWSRADPIAINASAVPGDATSAIIAPILGGAAYIARVAQVTATGKAGPWAYVTWVGTTDDIPPGDVTNFDWEIKPGQVVLTCDPCVDADYDATELRVGADWDTAAFLVRGATNEYHHPRPPNGTYTVLAKHRDTSGNYSETAASVTVTVDDSIDGGGGGFLVLEASGALFEFSDGTTHTSTSLPITFTARLVGLAGTVTWAATAYDDMTGGTAIGAVTLTTNGNAATMTAAQFVAPGTLGSVRRVAVTATLGSQSDTLDVYRYDPTVSSALLWLSNAQSVVPTDEAGEYGDYSGASTYAGVYKGNGSVIQDLTSAHTWTITPDSGVTATINGGAGPVSGASSILIAVSDMTIDDGVVLVTATPGSGPALTATFRVVKSKASGTGWTAYWEPGSLTLPVGDDGNVSGSGYSDFVIVNAQNQLPDTDNWAKSIATRNVVATLTGARATVTDWLPLGQVSAGAVIPATLHAGWTRADTPIYTPLGNWLQPGYNNSAPWATVRRATAYGAAPWTDIAVPSGWWAIGDASDDTIILGEVTGSSSRYIRSVDDGLTWIEETLPSGAQRTSWIHTGAEWLVSSHGSTAGYRSVTGVAGTWVPITLPGTACRLAGGAGVALATASGGVQYYSINGGVTWLPMADGYTGAAAFKGRLYTLLAGDPTKMLVWDGGRWVKQALPASAAGFSGLLVIRDVLYLIAGGNIMYTSDGLTWRAGGSGASTLGAWVRSGSRALQCDFIPHTDTSPAVSNYAKWTMLTATSDTVGSVTMLATKPDEADIQRVLPVYKGQAARVVYVASADPAILMLPATSDGVVTSYDNATVTGKITADGVDVTSLYTITWGTTDLTPSSGSGAVVNITAMPQAATEGTIVWQAVRAGYPVVTGTTFVRKSLSTDPSGPKLGRAFTVTAVSATYVALKFGADGYWYTKVGSGGAWVVQDRWVVGASPSAFWLYIPTPPEGAFTSGTTDTWLSLASDRIYVLDDATPGTHTRTVVVGMNSSASDVGAGWGNGALRLIVP